VVGVKEWDAMPKPQKPPKKHSELDDLVDQLESGQILVVGVTDETNLKGTRIGLARRAASRGFKLEFRADMDKLQLGARRSDEEYVPKAPAVREETAPRRGRPKKAQG
jgi:hypothetical protein